MINHSYNVKIDNLVRGRLTYFNNSFLNLVMIDNNNVHGFYFNTIREIKAFSITNKLKLTNFIRDELNEPYKSDPNYKYPFQTYTFEIKFQCKQLELFT